MRWNARALLRPLWMHVRALSHTRIHKCTPQESARFRGGKPGEFYKAPDWSSGADTSRDTRHPAHNWLPPVVKWSALPLSEAWKLLTIKIRGRAGWIFLFHWTSKGSKAEVCPGLILSQAVHTAKQFRLQLPHPNIHQKKGNIEILSVFHGNIPFRKFSHTTPQMRGSGINFRCKLIDIFATGCQLATNPISSL